MMYMTDWAARWAEYYPIKTAVREYETGESLTYRQLNQCAAYFVWQLTERYGLRPGDRVGILADFCLEYVCLISAAQKSGIAIVPLNYRLSSRELAYMVSNSTPAVLLVEDKYAALVRGPAGYTEEAFAQVRHILPLSEAIGWRREAAAGAVPGERNALPPPEAHQPLFIIYTSGTTGFPKGAVYSHQMAFWNSLNTQLRLDLTSADHTIVCMPPFHTGGLNVLLTPLLHHGGSFTLMKKFEAESVLHALEEEEATLFMAVPTMLRMMAESPAFEQVALEPLRYFIVGGEAMPIPLIETWQQKGVPIRQGYGLTEVGPNITSLHHDDAIRKKGSIGKPNFYVETRLVNEHGEEVGPNQPGELLLRGPMVTPGYWQNPEATAKAFTGEWFHTGDVLLADPEGYLYVKDRIKNMFISGGENVYPAEIELVLQTHPAVGEVAVVGVPHERWGEAGLALVVLRPGSHATPEDLIRFCEGKLARFKIPKSVAFLPELPKTDSGKIDRRSLAGAARKAVS